MEPRIQYAQTTDGVSIAFWTLGEGMPFVHMPRHPFSHIQMEWQFPEMRRWYERLAQKRMLVRYDGRGSGLSERNVADYSLDALVQDLGAVVDHLGLEAFALLGYMRTGPVAIAYAARHPERVSHLLLWCAQARTSDLLQSPQAEGLVSLIGKDWRLFTETAAHVAMGWSAGEPARRFAAYMRESTTPEEARGSWRPPAAAPKMWVDGQ
jgi:pimeloyl-ACP methyl ester carboxylesterase